MRYGCTQLGSIARTGAVDVEDGRAGRGRAAADAQGGRDGRLSRHRQRRSRAGGDQSPAGRHGARHGPGPFLRGWGDVVRALAGRPGACRVGRLGQCDRGARAGLSRLCSARGPSRGQHRPSDRSGPADALRRRGAHARHRRGLRDSGGAGERHPARPVAERADRPSVCRYHGGPGDASAVARRHHLSCAESGRAYFPFAAPDPQRRDDVLEGVRPGPFRQAGHRRGRSRHARRGLSQPGLRRRERGDRLHARRSRCLLPRIAAGTGRTPGCDSPDLHEGACGGQSCPGLHRPGLRAARRRRPESAARGGGAYQQHGAQHCRQWRQRSGEIQPRCQPRDAGSLALVHRRGGAGGRVVSP